jgi:adenylosuccinate lyase
LNQNNENLFSENKCLKKPFGTSASQRVLLHNKNNEEELMKMLGLPRAEVTTQITPPEETSRFYNELVHISGALSNLGDDIRILQMPEIGEVKSVSSSSSAMPNKDSNPIAAEQDAGMNVTVIAEFMKIPMTLTSNLYRDLRFSNVMRSYSSVAVYMYQQMQTTIRLLKSLQIMKEKCLENFNQNKYVLVAELLHLALQREGVPESHKLINEQIVPIAKRSGKNLCQVMDDYLHEHPNPLINGIWKHTHRFDEVKVYLRSPEYYLGDAVKIARREAENKL